MFNMRPGARKSINPFNFKICINTYRSSRTRFSVYIESSRTRVRVYMGLREQGLTYIYTALAGQGLTYIYTALAGQGLPYISGPSSTRVKCCTKLSHQNDRPLFIKKINDISSVRCGPMSRNVDVCD